MTKIKDDAPNRLLDIEWIFQLEFDTSSVSFSVTTFAHELAVYYLQKKKRKRWWWWWWWRRRRNKKEMEKKREEKLQLDIISISLTSRILQGRNFQMIYGIDMKVNIYTDTLHDIHKTKTLCLKIFLCQIPSIGSKKNSFHAIRSNASFKYRMKTNIIPLSTCLNKFLITITVTFNIKKGSLNIF